MPGALVRGYVSIGDGQIHYRVRPGRGTPVIYLHQTASSGRMWEEVMRRLGDVGPQYALDTPGFGGSFDPEGSPDIRQYAAWMLEAVAALGVAAFHLVGHHTGAVIAAEMARLAPARLRGLAMIGPAPLTAEERAAFRERLAAGMPPRPDGSHLSQAWDYLPGLAAHPLLRHREALDLARAWRGRTQAYAAVWDYDFQAAFVGHTGPLLLVTAPGDVLLPWFDVAKALRPDARAVSVEGGNFQPDEDPDGVARTLSAFLRDAAV